MHPLYLPWHLALSCTIFELFGVQNIVTLKSLLDYGSLNVAGSGTTRQIACGVLYVFHCKYVYLVPLLRYSALNISVAMKSGLWPYLKMMQIARWII